MMFDEITWPILPSPVNLFNRSRQSKYYNRTGGICYVRAQAHFAANNVNREFNVDFNEKSPRARRVAVARGVFGGGFWGLNPPTFFVSCCVVVMRWSFFFFFFANQTVKNNVLFRRRRKTLVGFGRFLPAWSSRWGGERGVTARRGGPFPRPYQKLPPLHTFLYWSESRGGTTDTTTSWWSREAARRERLCDVGRSGRAACRPRDHHHLHHDLKKHFVNC